MKIKRYHKPILKLIEDCKFVSKTTVTRVLSKTDRRYNKFIDLTLKDLVESGKIFVHRLHSNKFKIYKSKKYYSKFKILHAKEHWGAVEKVISYKLLQGHHVKVEQHVEGLANSRPDIVVFDKDTSQSIFYEVENLRWKTRYEKYIISKLNMYKEANLLGNLKIVCSDDGHAEKVIEYIHNHFEDEIGGVSTVNQYEKGVKLNDRMCYNDTKQKTFKLL